MAASDAKPFPIKNTAYRITFPILDSDGDLVTGAASLDTELSLDGGTFADATNEATEIATSSGIYYLDLTSGEMNYDTVAIIVKTSTSGAKTTVIILNPVESGDIPVNVKQISDDATAADNCELMFDGTGYAGGTTKLDVNIAAITAGIIANASLNADVGSTAYATNIIALAVRKVLDELNLDHLLKVATAGADMTTEITDDSIVSRILSNGDTSIFDPSTDGLQPIRDQIVVIDGIVDDILVDTGTTLDTKINTIDDLLDTEIAKLLSLVINKRGLRKTDSTWYIYVRNAADDTDILLKALKDKDGNDITDPQAGAIAGELASTV